MLRGLSVEDQGLLTDVEAEDGVMEPEPEPEPEPDLEAR